jgi:hypothetical protein
MAYIAQFGSGFNGLYSELAGESAWWGFLDQSRRCRSEVRQLANLQRIREQRVLFFVEL